MRREVLAMYITPRARELYDRLARGWNTWDVSSVGAHVFLPDRLRVNLAVLIPRRNGFSGDSLWANVADFGEHAFDDSYTDVTLRYLERRFRVETASHGRELRIRVTPAPENAGLGKTYLVLEVSNIWGGKNVLIPESDGTITARGPMGEHTVRFAGTAAEPEWNPSDHLCICLDGEDTAYFYVNCAPDPAETDRLIAEAGERWLGSVLRSTEEKTDGMLAAQRRSLLWNLVYDSRHGRVITPVSRNWCRNMGRHFGDYVLFDWDTFFAALQYGLLSRDYAYAAFFSMLEEITPEGMIPNFGCATGQSRDRSEPQVGALCAMKLYARFGDKWFLEECFDRLYAWNEWRMKNRDGNGDGLLELASTPYDADYDDAVANGAPSYDGIPEGGITRESTSHAMRGAKWESGLDNSTMWDKAVYNPEKHCMELSYVGLNALVAADSFLLADMAEIVGKDSALVQKLRNRGETLSRRIHDELWSEKDGIYLNRHWSGEFDPTLSLTHFYTLLTGTVPEDRKEKLLRHLLSEEEFWGEYVVPNIARCDASFPEQDYWRGRIWAPTNFLLGESLLRSGCTDVLRALTEKGCEMFSRCWEEKGVVGENYNAITGEAAEVGNSDRFYHWGALFVYMLTEEAVLCDAFTGKSTVKSFPAKYGTLYNLPLGDGYYTADENGLRRG